jgi:cytochrome c oxidase cbb3-type subunit 3
MKRRSIVVLAFGTLALMSGRADVMDSSTDARAGRALFLKNCAHCHGADAHGDDGPDLHKLDESDEWIAARIRNGKAGQMTAFAGKLQASEINCLIAYLHTLK